MMVCVQEKDESDNYHEAAISRSVQGRVGVCDHHSKGNLAKVSSERQEKNRNKCNIHNITSSQGNHPDCHMYPKNSNLPVKDCSIFAEKSLYLDEWHLLKHLTSYVHGLNQILTTQKAMKVLIHEWVLQLILVCCTISHFSFISFLLLQIPLSEWTMAHIFYQHAFQLPLHSIVFHCLLTVLLSGLSLQFKYCSNSCTYSAYSYFEQVTSHFTETSKLSKLCKVPALASLVTGPLDHCNIL